MSAFIVSEKHINTLVGYGSGGQNPVSVRLSDGDYLNFNNSEHLARAAEILWRENHRSVNYRYDESNEPAPYAFKPGLYTRQPVDILKACDCYDYQACETPDYYETDAARIITALRKRATRNLPGYDKAAWEII